MLPPIVNTDKRAVAQKIVDLANDAIAQKNSFHIVLAGGETPRAIYTLLRDAKTAWQHWYIYFGDERCEPLQHPQRNDTMAFDTWLAHVNIPPAQIHCIPAELPFDICVDYYSRTLSHIDLFDLVLLGLGEDGHTASLFPGENWGTEINAPSVLAVHCAPKPPSRRITMSAQRLSAADQIWFLVKGQGKKQILQRWQAGENLPASRIQAKKEMVIFRL